MGRRGRQRWGGWAAAALLTGWTGIAGGQEEGGWSTELPGDRQVRQAALAAEAAAKEVTVQALRAVRAGEDPAEVLARTVDGYAEIVAAGRAGAAEEVEDGIGALGGRGEAAVRGWAAWMEGWLARQWRRWGW